ncbi:MAG: hypothetical protein HONDAALG_02109 [Gammaproteobacteria bacterium]|nr:hypothetical protein [Gammaproteobacteria bacterium]
MGNPFTISYTVSDSGGSGLNRVELWRTVDKNGSPDSSKWGEVKRKSASGMGPTYGSFSDAPTIGIYWYGIHALDNANKQGNEPKGPIKVVAKALPLITWVTHGYTQYLFLPASDAPPDWVKTLAKNTQTQSGQPAFFFNWKAQSNNAGGGWAEASGELLAAKIAADDPSKSQDYHLVGHSLGTVVVSEAARRLRAWGYQVRQISYLDAVDGPRVFTTAVGVESSRFNPLVGAWVGVDRIDNYWGNGKTLPVTPNLILQGHNVDGAINRILPDEDHEGLHDFYDKTVLDPLGNRTGWYWSLNGGGWSVNVGETKTRHPLDRDGKIPRVFNGDFSAVDASQSGASFAGYEWQVCSKETKHACDGGSWDEYHGHKFVQLRERPGNKRGNFAAFLPTVSGSTGIPKLEHAPVFIPPGAAILKFNLWIEKPDAGDFLRIYINEDQNDQDGRFDRRVHEVNLNNRTTGFQEQRINISQFAGRAVRIKFTVEDPGISTVSSQVWIDDIDLDLTPRTFELLVAPAPFNGKITASGINCGAGGTGDCTAPYGAGATVELIAIPINGYRIGQWTGCQSSNGDRCVVQMTQARTVSATFTQACPLPRITAQPRDYRTEVGGIASFISAASGDPAPVVQWQVAPSGSNTFSNVPGATNMALSFRATSEDNGKRYRAVFTNTCGPAVSNEAVLTLVTPLLVSEFRFSGSGGSGDWFVELYNNTSAPLSVVGHQLGFTSATGNASFAVNLPANGVIPARSNYLITGPNYSLLGVAAPDLQVLALPFPNIGGVGVFKGAISAANRLDSVAYNSVPANASFGYFREGIAIPSLGATTAEHSWLRKLVNGLPQDTNNNQADFALLSPQGNNINGVVAALGVVGPQSSTGPKTRNDTVADALFDPIASSAAAPNRVRNITPVPNGALGTLILRRSFTNNTGAPITKLRFRIVDITNSSTGAEAELRLLSSVDAVINGKQVRGLKLEQPTMQPAGGGLNSTLAAGVITLANPLAAGASVNVEFLLGVMRGGGYRFFVNIEAAP